MLRNSRLGLLALGVILALAVSACGSKPAPPPAPAKPAPAAPAAPAPAAPAPAKQAAPAPAPAKQAAQPAADPWPTGPVTLAIYSSAGGGTDRMARLLAPALQKKLGNPVVVENQPGGGGLVAMTELMRRPPDGNRIVVTNQPDLDMTVMRGASYGYDASDIIAVQMIDPRLFLARKDSPYGSLVDVAKAAKAAPGKMTVSTTTGTAQALFTKWLVDRLDGTLRMVGYDGGGEARSAVIGGHVTFTVGDDFSALSMRNELKGIALAGKKASPRWPEAGVFQEQLKQLGLDMPTATFGARVQIYVVPTAFKKQFPQRYEKLQKAFLDAMKDADYLEQMKKDGVTDLLVPAPGSEWDATFKKERPELERLLKAIEKK